MAEWRLLFSTHRLPRCDARVSLRKNLSAPTPPRTHCLHSSPFENKAARFDNRLWRENLTRREKIRPPSRVYYGWLRPQARRVISPEQPASARRDPIARFAPKEWRSSRSVRQ